MGALLFGTANRHRARCFTEWQIGGYEHLGQYQRQYFKYECVHIMKTASFFSMVKIIFHDAMSANHL